MSAKTDKINIRISSEDKAWLSKEADRLGLDPADVVRMAVRQLRNGTIGQQGRTERTERIAFPQSLPQTQQRQVDIEQYIEEEQAEDDFEFPPEEEYQEPVQAAPQVQRQRPSLMQHVPEPLPTTPGAVTRPSGINRQVGQGYSTGDAAGNILRQNIGHLGFSDGFSR